MSAKLERIVNLVEEVNRGRYPSVQDLCSLFEIAERTLYDDITFINDRLNIEIKFDHSKRGYYNATPDRKLPTFELMESELLALAMGKDMLQTHTGNTFRPQLEQAIDKIAQRVPDLSAEVEELRALIKFRAGGIVSVPRHKWFDFHDACESRHRVEIEYFTAYTGNTQWRTIDPYMLVAHNGAWYLPSYCHLRKDRRLFALHRVLSYKVLQEKYDPPPADELQKWLDDAFLLEHGDGEQHIVIKFTPIGARYAAERQFHPTQKMTPHPDGSMTMEFKAFNLEEVKRWVLTYGASAEVIEPADLRRRVKDELSNALSTYSAS